MTPSREALRASVKELKQLIAKLEQEQEKEELAFHQLQADHHLEQFQTKSYKNETKENIIQHNQLLQKNVKKELELRKLEALLEIQESECSTGADNIHSETVQEELAALMEERESVNVKTKEIMSQMKVIDEKISKLKQEYETIIVQCIEEQKTEGNYLQLKIDGCLRNI